MKKNIIAVVAIGIIVIAAVVVLQANSSGVTGDVVMTQYGPRLSGYYEDSDNGIIIDEAGAVKIGEEGPIYVDKCRSINMVREFYLQKHLWKWWRPAYKDKLCWGSYDCKTVETTVFGETKSVGACLPRGRDEEPVTEPTGPVADPEGTYCRDTDDADNNARLNSDKTERDVQIQNQAVTRIRNADGTVRYHIRDRCVGDYAVLESWCSPDYNDAIPTKSFDCKKELGANYVCRDGACVAA